MLLRDVATELAKLGFVNQRGAVFSAALIQSVVERGITFGPSGKLVR